MPLKAGDPCPICLQNGRCGSLTPQQINFSEALLLCDHPGCVFPMGYHDFDEYRVDNLLPDIELPESTPSHQNLSESLSFLQEILGTDTPNPAAMMKNPVRPEIEVVKKTIFLQWRNNNALCWLDVLLNLLVHCSWLRRLVESGDRTLPETIPMLLATYDNALGLMTKPRNKELKSVVPSGGGSEDPAPQQGGNPILRRFFDSLDVYGLSGKDKKRNSEPVKEPEPTYSVLNYDSHQIADLAKKVASKAVKVEDKPEALVKLRKQLRHAASQFKNVDIRVYQDAEQLLNRAREEIWAKLQPLMQCEKGKNDSPLIALFVLLHTWTTESSPVSKLFNISGRWEMKCAKCKKCSTMTISAKAIVTFPLVQEDFSVNNAYFIRTCPSCSAPNQQYRLHIDQMPECLMFHFMNGLPSSDLDKYAFTRNGESYRVRALVRYRNKPTDHFISYIRDGDAKMWMECDDLKSPLCSFSMRKLQIPASEIHLVMWERHPSGPQLRLVSPAVSQSGILKSAPSTSHSTASSHPLELPKETGSNSDVAGSTTSQVDSKESSVDFQSDNSSPCKQGAKSSKSRGSSGNRRASKRSSRAATPNPTGASGSDKNSEGSGDKGTVVSSQQPARTIESLGSAVSKIARKELRENVFNSKPVEYVWDKLTSDKNVTSNDVAMKAIADQSKRRTTEATPKLKSRLSTYLSSLKPQNSASKDFGSYKTGQKTSVESTSSSSVPDANLTDTATMNPARTQPSPAEELPDQNTSTTSQKNNDSFTDTPPSSSESMKPPVSGNPIVNGVRLKPALQINSAPLETDIPFTVGGRALSMDDSSSIVSSLSFTSFPSGVDPGGNTDVSWITDALFSRPHQALKRKLQEEQGKLDDEVKDNRNSDGSVLEGEKVVAKGAEDDFLEHAGFGGGPSKPKRPRRELIVELEDCANLIGNEKSLAKKDVEKPAMTQNQSAAVKTSKQTKTSTSLEKQPITVDTDNSSDTADELSDLDDSIACSSDLPDILTEPTESVTDKFKPVKRLRGRKAEPRKSKIGLTGFFNTHDTGKKIRDSSSEAFVAGPTVDSSITPGVSTKHDKTTDSGSSGPVITFVEQESGLLLTSCKKRKRATKRRAKRTTGTAEKNEVATIVVKPVERYNDEKDSSVEVRKNITNTSQTDESRSTKSIKIVSNAETSGADVNMSTGTEPEADLSDLSGFMDGSICQMDLDIMDSSQLSEDSENDAFAACTSMDADRRRVRTVHLLDSESEPASKPEAGKKTAKRSARDANLRKGSKQLTTVERLAIPQPVVGRKVAVPRKNVEPTEPTLQKGVPVQDAIKDCLERIASEIDVDIEVPVNSNMLTGNQGTNNQVRHYIGYPPEAADHNPARENTVNIANMPRKTQAVDSVATFSPGLSSPGPSPTPAAVSASPRLLSSIPGSRPQEYSVLSIKQRSYLQNQREKERLKKTQLSQVVRNTQPTTITIREQSKESNSVEFVKVVRVKKEKVSSGVQTEVGESSNMADVDQYADFAISKPMMASTPNRPVCRVNTPVSLQSLQLSTQNVRRGKSSEVTYKQCGSLSSMCSPARPLDGMVDTSESAPTTKTSNIVQQNTSSIIHQLPVQALNTGMMPHEGGNMMAQQQTAGMVQDNRNAMAVNLVQNPGGLSQNPVPTNLSENQSVAQNQSVVRIQNQAAALAQNQPGSMVQNPVIANMAQNQLVGLVQNPMAANMAQNQIGGIVQNPMVVNMTQNQVGGMVQNPMLANTNMAQNQMMMYPSQMGAIIQNPYTMNASPVTMVQNPVMAGQNVMTAPQNQLAMGQKLMAMGHSMMTMGQNQLQNQLAMNHAMNGGQFLVNAALPTNQMVMMNPMSVGGQFSSLPIPAQPSGMMMNPNLQMMQNIQPVNVASSQLPNLTVQAQNPMVMNSTVLNANVMASSQAIVQNSGSQSAVGNFQNVTTQSLVNSGIAQPNLAHNLHFTPR